VDPLYFKQARLLLRILPIVGKHTDFAIKGGTAINFFIRELPRLSVDIDLTYLPVGDRTASLKAISDMLVAVSKEAQHVLPRVHVAVTRFIDQSYIRMLVVRLGNAQVKIEVNPVLRGCVFGTETKPLCRKAEDIFELSLRAQILSLPDLYGGKICAALDRQHPRDLYDIKLLFENEGLTKEIRKAFIVYLISHDKPMAELLDPKPQDFKRLYQNEFAGMAVEEISYDDLLEVRDRLVTNIKASLSDEERRFIISVKEGNPSWELLVLQGIDTLPAVTWKLLNIRQMDRKKHKQALEKLRKCLNL
jgi:predicted nucleotidyltransferase component of viral defense system